MSRVGLLRCCGLGPFNSSHNYGRHTTSLSISPPHYMEQIRFCNADSELVAPGLRHFSVLSTARAASSLFTCPKHVREVACDESTSGPAPRRSTFLCIGKRLDPHSHSQTSSHSWTGIRFADGWPTVLQYYQPGRKPDIQSLPPFYAHRETTGHCSLSQRSERVFRLAPRSRTEVLWLSDIYIPLALKPPCVSLRKKSLASRPAILVQLSGTDATRFCATTLLILAPYRPVSNPYHLKCSTHRLGANKFRLRVSNTRLRLLAET